MEYPVVDVCSFLGLIGIMSDFNRGNELLRSGKLDEAIAAYKNAIAAYPSFHWYHYQLGEAFAKKGEWQQAIIHYQKATEINPSSRLFQSSCAFASEQIKINTYGSDCNLNSHINLALNKPTAQSSIYRLNQYDHHGACNGNKNGKCGFHTLKENNPWWQIDLQDIYHLSKIKIYNRINCCQPIICSKRASTINVLLSQDALSWKLVYQNPKSNVFGGINGKPLIIDPKSSLSRYVRLQLRENEYFHLDEVEIYGFPVKTDAVNLKATQDEAALSANFYAQASLPPPPPKEIPTELIADFTIGKKIPVIHYYYNNTRSSAIKISMQAYLNTFDQLDRGSFKYYGKTLDYLLGALDHYSVSNKSVLIFGLNRVNCDAISIWKGARYVYVIDYNLPVSEHPQVKIFSYADYISQNIKADAAISISSFEHDGLGRYGDPINPTGDLEAMKLAKKLIKKNGLLFFSVPISPDCIVWNAHRIYGKIRLPMMFEGWKVLNSFGFSNSLIEDQKLGRYQQPVFVLQNL